VVGDNTFWDAVELLDVVEKEPSCSFHCDRCMRRNKVYSLGDRIHDSHDGIMSRELQESDHEIDTKRIPPCIQNREQLKLTNWRVSPGFRPEAEVTDTYILANIPRHLRPPVVPRYQF